MGVVHHMTASNLEQKCMPSSSDLSYIPFLNAFGKVNLNTLFFPYLIGSNVKFSFHLTYIIFKGISMSLPNDTPS